MLLGSSVSNSFEILTKNEDPLADPDAFGITISGCGAWESSLLVNLSGHCLAHYNSELLR